MPIQSYSVIDIDISGEWQCSFKGFDENLLLAQGGEYTKTNEMFGVMLQDRGNWFIEEDILHLNRSFHINNGKEVQSDFTFKREIKILTQSELITEHHVGDGKPVTTTCQRI